MIALLVASACLAAGSCVLVLAAGVPRPHRLSGTLVLSLAMLVVLSVAMGTIGRYAPGPLLWVSAGYLIVAGLTAWLLRRRRASRVASVGGAARAPATSQKKSPGRSIGVAANAVFGVLLLANVAEYTWRGVLATRLPPLGYDALYYHLINIREWVRHQALVDPFIGLARGSRDPGPLTQADSFPKNAELVGGWLAVFTRSMASVGLTQILFVVMLGISVTGLCRALDIRADLARIAGAWVCLCPAVVAQSDELYVDIARTAPVIAAFEFILVTFSPEFITDTERASVRRVALPLAGLALGFAAAVKASNLLFVLVVPLVAAGLSAARSRADISTGRSPDIIAPSFRTSSLALLLVPTAALGSYWYLRTWVSWGSPFWPYTAGPFTGRSSFSGSFAEILRSDYHTHSAVLALLKSWWAATSLYDGPLRGDQYVGGLGLLWLVAGIPAVFLLLLRSHWNRRAAFAVVLPLGAGTLLGPAAYDTRYSIPLAACGVVALATLLNSGVGRRSKASLWTLPGSTSGQAPATRGSTRVAPSGVMGFSVVVMLASALALSDAWAATRLGNWTSFELGLSGLSLELSEKSPVPSLHNEIAAVRAPGRERANAGVIGLYTDTMRKLNPRLPIAFFADHVPPLTYPLLGPDRERDLVVLPGPAEAAGAVVARRGGIRYLYSPYPLPLIGALLDEGARIVGPLYSGVILDLSPALMPYRSPLPKEAEVDRVVPRALPDAFPAPLTTLTGLSPSIHGCGRDSIGSYASDWSGQAPYALHVIACAYRKDSTPTVLARTIITGLYDRRWTLKYANETKLTQVFERRPPWSSDLRSGKIEVVIIVRLLNRLAVLDVVTDPRAHPALVTMALKMTERFGADK